MAICFVTGNIPTDSVVYANLYPTVVTDPNSFTVTVDDSDQMVQDLIKDVTSHKFSELMTGKPYIKTQYNGSNLILTLMNPPSTGGSNIAVSMLGKSLSVPLANNQAIIPITVHPSVASQRIEITAIMDGFPYSYIDIGGSGGNIDKQMYQDSNGSYHVVPLNNADLAMYWQNELVNPVWNQADIATALGIIMTDLYGKILPLLQNQTYTPLSLTSAEQNGLNDIKTNILSQIASKLDNIFPDGVTPDVHYSSYRAHMKNANDAMSSYVADYTEILKYTALK